MNYFISDLHFLHENILGYDVRPFRDVGSMTAELTGRWNSVVADDDDVYILGDFVWTKDKIRASEIIAYLRGRKHLIIGNHDQVFTKNKKYFIENEGLIEEMVEYKEMDIPGRSEKLILCHYPMPFYKNSLHEWYHFYGHVHATPEWDCCESIRATSARIYGRHVNMANVGCMMPYVNYTPRTFEEIKKHIDSLYTDNTPKEGKKGKK